MSTFDLNKFKLWKLHVFFWTCFYFLSVLIIGTNRSFDPTVIVSIINFITLIPLIYLILFYFLPKYWNLNKLVFFVLVILTVSILGIIRFHTIHGIANLVGVNFDELGDDGYIFQVSLEILFILVIGLPLKLITSFISNLKREKEILEQKLETEMKYLRVQLNPHFLFNALNNVYSLSFRKDETSSEMILKISEILRYVLYDSNEATVSILEEVKFLRNYIELHEIEREHQKVNVQIDIQEDIDIVPHLFMPLVENAFKYSNLSMERSFVNMKISYDASTLFFQVENSIDGKFEKGTGGIGLQNLRKRLDIYYSGQHSLQIDQSQDHYSVSLQINFSL